VAGGRVELVFFDFWEQGGGAGGVLGRVFSGQSQGQKGANWPDSFFRPSGNFPAIITKTSFKGTLNKIIL
jgi:hypothetical protein